VRTTSGGAAVVMTARRGRSPTAAGPGRRAARAPGRPRRPGDQPSRARRTLRGIGEQVAKAGKAVAGMTPVRRNRFIQLSGGTRSVNRTRLGATVDRSDDRV
jgi:hypothetical protein